jgi:hypothetical protein
MAKKKVASEKAPAKAAPVKESASDKIERILAGAQETTMADVTHYILSAGQMAELREI